MRSNAGIVLLFVTTKRGKQSILHHTLSLNYNFDYEGGYTHERNDIHNSYFTSNVYDWRFCAKRTTSECGIDRGRLHYGVPTHLCGYKSRRVYDFVIRSFALKM